MNPEFKEKQETALSFWPSPQDYNEALQNPDSSFFDSELQCGQAELNPLGLPKPVSGAFASVYRLSCPERDLAARCFLTAVADRRARYAAIESALEAADMQCTVGFDYQEQGIAVRGTPFPILKMDWVEGECLHDFIARNLDRPALLSDLAGDFQSVLAELKSAGVAHGDLQHGNIMVVGGKIKLVDYDGMYVPMLAGLEAEELGHINYQHPQRNNLHFGPWLDNFSAWLIYVCLRCLAVDPGLWSELRAGEDCLLFRRGDLENPETSRAFARLEHHESEAVRKLARSLRGLLAWRLEDIPYLDEDLPEAEGLADLPEPGLLPESFSPATAGLNQPLALEQGGGTRRADPYVRGDAALRMSRSLASWENETENYRYHRDMRSGWEALLGIVCTLAAIAAMFVLAPAQHQDSRVPASPSSQYSLSAAGPAASAPDIFRSPMPSLSKAEVSVAMSADADSSFQAEDYARAAEFYERHIETLAAKTGARPQTLAHSHHYLGYCYLFQGRYADAESQFRQALKLYRSKDGAALSTTGDIENDIGVSLVYRKMYDQALKHYRSALALRERSAATKEEKEHLADTLSNIGLVYQEMGRYADSLPYLTRASSLQQAIGDDAGRRNSLSALESAYSRLNLPDKRRQVLDEIKKIESRPDGRSSAFPPASG